MWNGINQFERRPSAYRYRQPLRSEGAAETIHRLAVFCHHHQMVHLVQRIHVRQALATG